MLNGCPLLACEYQLLMMFVEITDVTVLALLHSM
jgi:hypothetical protein